RVQLEDLLQQRQVAIEALEQSESRLETVENEGPSLHQIYIEAQTAFKQIEARLRRFHQVDGQLQCNYCGQPLTVEHLETERNHLEKGLAAAQTAAIEAEMAYQKALNEHQLLRQTVKSETEHKNALHL